MRQGYRSRVHAGQCHPSGPEAQAVWLSVSQVLRFPHGPRLLISVAVVAMPIHAASFHSLCALRTAECKSEWWIRWATRCAATRATLSSTDTSSLRSVVVGISAVGAAVL